MALLFALSLVPFATAYMGENRMSAISVALYCTVLLSCNLLFAGLRMAIARHFGEDARLRAWHRAAARKNWFASALYAAGVFVAFLSPTLALVLSSPMRRSIFFRISACATCKRGPSQRVLRATW